MAIFNSYFDKTRGYCIDISLIQFPFILHQHSHNQIISQISIPVISQNINNPLANIQKTMENHHFQ